MASGSATSKLGNIAALGQQSAASNLQAFQQAQQAQQQANQQALAATAAASDIYSKDLASNFERNVKPALNQWENFQQMGSSLAGQAVGQTMSSYHDNSNAIFNMLQNTENNLASASASARAYEDYINYAPQEGVMMYLTGNILG
jgi:type II secretory pathway pseudopilin PulG